MLSGATHLIIKDHNRRPGLQYIASIGPQVSPFRLSLARIKLRHRCFIGMQYAALQ